MAKRGRKLKLTRELIQRAAELVREGNYQKHVAQALGIDKSTWFKWLQEGERGETRLKREFFDAIKKAEAEAIIRNNARIQSAARGWQASAWWLERRYPEEWGRKDRMNIDTGDGIKIQIMKVEGMQTEVENNSGDA